MDPSRIRLEDDRFGLISLSFRPQNRATFLGRDSDDFVWAVGIVVGDEDEIQTVEIDQHGAKSSRMLTPGELFEGLEIMADPGESAHVIVGTLTLLGMDLRASDTETAHEFADLLRGAADDRGWRLPLHLTGQPRDLQLSAQGREILRQTASSIEREGHARTSLSAASRLELSSQTLDSVRRRISRKSLQAYRMHGRWYVVLDNLARSRSSELNGSSTASIPQAPPAEPLSPFEEAPVEVEAEPQQTVATEIAIEEPFVSSAEQSMPDETIHVEEEAEREAPFSEPEAVLEAPTEDDLAAFVSEPTEAEPEPVEAELEAVETEPEPITQELPVAEIGMAEEPAEPSLAAEAASEQLAAEAAPVQPETEATDHGQPITEAEEEPDSSFKPFDQFISESVLDQFIISGAETILTQQVPVESAVETPDETEADVAADQVTSLIQESFEGAAPETELEAATEEALDANLEAPSDLENAESVVAESTLPDVETDLTEEEVAPVAETLAEPAEELQSPAPEVSDEAEVIDEEGPSVAAEMLEEEAVEPAGDLIDEESIMTVEMESPSESAAMEEPEAEPLAAEEAEELQESVATTESEESVTMTSAEAAQVVEEFTEPEAVFEAEEEAEAAPTVSDEAEVLETDAVPEETAEQAEDVEITVDAESEEATSHEAAEQAEDVEITVEAEPEEATSHEAVEQAEGVEITADAWSDEETRQEASESEPEPEAEEDFASARIEGPELNLLVHLRDEVDFLRQQGQEKDRQIVAWINGAQWLQPFVDQIRSLEQQVERLGELQAQRDGDRISDLMSERDTLRTRLESLETEINEARASVNSADANRRSWFRRMMGSD